MNRQVSVSSDLACEDRCALILLNMPAPFASLRDLLAEADDAPQGEKRSDEYGELVGVQRIASLYCAGF